MRINKNHGIRINTAQRLPNDSKTSKLKNLNIEITSYKKIHSKSYPYKSQKENNSQRIAYYKEQHGSDPPIKYVCKKIYRFQWKYSKRRTLQCDVKYETFLSYKNHKCKKNMLIRKNMYNRWQNIPQVNNYVSQKLQPRILITDNNKLILNSRLQKHGVYVPLGTTIALLI